MATLNRPIRTAMEIGRLIAGGPRFMGTLDVGDDVVSSSVYGSQSGIIRAVGVVPGDLYLAGEPGDSHWIIINDKLEPVRMEGMYDGHIRADN